MVTNTHFLFFMFVVVSCNNLLHDDDARALKEIGKKLELRGWDFSEDPCSGNGNWTSKLSSNPPIERSLTCNCSYHSPKCHITEIVLRSQNLSGIIPPEFSKLHHLKTLLLDRNCLTGSIPKEWASMRLEVLSLFGNRLSGSFPQILTRITSLRILNLEGNRFSGPISPKIGKLIYLEELYLSSNAFSGSLPEQLGLLKNLTHIRISDNNFIGLVPDFVGNWTNLLQMQMYGSGLEGPLPSSLSALTSLSHLQISDLGGKSSSFPPLKDLGSLNMLELRRCNLNGQIPEYIGHMKNLRTLDLSFNFLTGKIPLSFANLKTAEFVFLTENKLTGGIPNHFIERNINLDLSYNNFTLQSSIPNVDCDQVNNLNLVESFFSWNKSNGRDRGFSCYLQNFPCLVPKREYMYKLYINSGGEELKVDKEKIFEANLKGQGASTFVYGAEKHWAFSSTGRFVDDVTEVADYTASNTSTLSVNASSPSFALYKTARISPLVLTFYALCLGNGNYTVSLHFAEIIITDDSSFYSLGKRVFDIYVQERLVFRNFNIKEAAGGSGKPIIKKVVVNVTDHNLKISLRWNGKGTTTLPISGAYGPMISAISVEPNFKPPVYHDKRIVPGIIVAAIIFFSLIIAILLWRRCHKKTMNRELRGSDLRTGKFSLDQIKAATNNFDPANKIGEGGFGSVFKGVLSDGTMIAVKQLSSKSSQGTQEFLNEMGMISSLQHPNLVKLYGCCVEKEQLMLVYEFLKNNCLSRALFGKDERLRVKIDWLTRKKIYLGIAKGLAFLHEGSAIKVIHRDIKASNVLLDKYLNAKISDFGLASLRGDENTYMDPVGTIGYMAPEYFTRGHLTEKADVYSFGVVALEIVSGRSSTSFMPSEDFTGLLDWAYDLQSKECLLELVDPKLGSDYSKEEAMVMLKVALLCTNYSSPTLRPTMSQVVSMIEEMAVISSLEGHSAVGDTSIPNFSLSDLTADFSQSSGDNKRLDTIYEDFSYDDNIGSS